MTKVKVKVLVDGTRYDGVEYPAGTTLMIEEDLVETWAQRGLSTVIVEDVKVEDADVAETRAMTPKTNRKKLKVTSNRDEEASTEE